MKKILTFAVMALLIGGFAFNANAQKNTKKTSRTTSPKSEVVKAVKGNDCEKELKNFEQAVDKCVTLYENMKNAEKENGKISPKNFDESLAKAEELKLKLETKKDQLSRSQVDRYNKACEKLQTVYKKG